MKRTRLFALIGIPLLAIGAYFLLKDPAKSGEVEDLIAEVKEAISNNDFHFPNPPMSFSIS